MNGESDIALHEQEHPGELDRLYPPAHTEQPAPTGGTGDCWAELLEHVGPGHVAYDLGVKRRAFGLQKYHGQPVRRGDGRDEDLDLVEELLDASVYAWRTNRRELSLALLWHAGKIGGAR